MSYVITNQVFYVPYSTEIPNKDNLVVHMKDISLEDWNESHHDSASQLNMQGVFLHLLGDAPGSVIVVVNALTFTYVWQPCHAGETCVNPCYNSHDYTDHHQQHVNATLITMLGSSTQTTVHLLAGSRIIATAHIKCLDPASYMDVAMQIKGLFHEEGIHATTVQPEFVTVNFESNIYVCELSCRMQCAPKLCCGSFDRTGLGGPVREEVSGLSLKVKTVILSNQFSMCNLITQLN
uniref:Uncharacterized protein n=1 Tax=Hucho hucho TaxID=62062 RepID=A0A4W5MLN2_9TELE